MGSIDELLEEARRLIAPRLPPRDLAAAFARGALVVDTRPLEQRTRDGDLPGAVVIDRNVLEWRLDPSCEHRIAAAADPDREVVIVCNEGYSSSLAAATLRQLGRTDVTDLEGGYAAWKALLTSSGASTDRAAPAPQDRAGPPSSSGPAAQPAWR